MKPKLLACVVVALFASHLNAQHAAETPTTSWMIFQNEDAISYDHGRLHIVSWAAGETESHAYATLQLPIPLKVRGFTLEFELKLGEANAAPVLFEARAGDKRPLNISYSSVDNKCRITLAGNEVSNEVGDKEWHTFKLVNDAGRLSLYRDKEELASLPNKTVPDLLRFGGEFGAKGKQSEAWMRLLTAKFVPESPDKASAETSVNVDLEKEPASKDKTLLSGALVSLDVTEISNPKGKDPTVESGLGQDNWYVHVALKNEANTPLNYYDFGPLWIKFDNYQTINGMPFLLDPSIVNSSTKEKGVFRAGKRSECWLQPGHSADVFYFCSSSVVITGKPVSIEFVSGGTFKYGVPPP